MKTTIKEVLKKPEKYKVTWSEPWIALDEFDQETDAVVEYSISIKDCIRVSRHTCSLLNEKRDREIILDEQGLLEEFIIMNQASIRV